MRAPAWILNKIAATQTLKTHWARNLFRMTDEERERDQELQYQGLTRNGTPHDVAASYQELAPLLVENEAISRFVQAQNDPELRMVLPEICTIAEALYIATRERPMTDESVQILRRMLERVPDRSMSELKVSRRPLIDGLRQLRPAIVQERFHGRPAWLSFANGELTIEIDRGAVRVPADGSWPHVVETTSGMLRILDAKLPAGDPLTVRYESDELAVYGSASRWSCPAKVQAPPAEYEVKGNGRPREVKSRKRRVRRSATPVVAPASEQQLRGVAVAAVRAALSQFDIRGPFPWSARETQNVRVYSTIDESSAADLVFFLASPQSGDRLQSSTCVVVDKRNLSVVAVMNAGDEG